jgi:hypothetical protein
MMLLLLISAAADPWHCIPARPTPLLLRLTLHA